MKHRFLSLMLVAAAAQCGGCGVAGLAVRKAATLVQEASTATSQETPRGPNAGERSRAPRPGAVMDLKAVLPQPSQEATLLLKQELANTSSWSAQVSRGTLSPLPSGHGIVVCEPSTRAGDASVREFGAGCGRWLHFEVGGQGELGKTPIWGAIDDARRELKLPSLRLTPQQAANIAQKTGATHAATGQIRGNSASAILTYQLWKMPEGKAIGAPLVARGSLRQIVQQLPAVARGMAVRLGSATPKIRATINATPQEMALLGQVPWKAQTAVSSAQAKQLETISQRVPLAALLLLRSGALLDGSTLYGTTANRLLTSAPDNTLAVADVAWKATDKLTPHNALLQRNRQRYPNNYLLSLAETCRQRALKNRVAERSAAEHAVRCAPQSGFAWTELGESIYNQAESLRRSRFIGQLSAKEMAVVRTLYPQYVTAALRAVQLDPGSSHAWLTASKACAFNGQGEIADVAFWKALSLNRRQRDIYWWGLQLYQPKWFNDSNKLHLLTGLVSSDYELFSIMYDDVVYALRNAGFQSEAQAKLLEAVAMFENAVRRDSKNAMAHLHWAELAKNHGHDGSKDDIAVREYRTYVALRPDDAGALYDLGWVLHYKKRQYNAAEKCYRRALALAPEFGNATNALGDITYYVHHDAKGAEALYRKAISIYDDGLYHAELARLLLDTNRRSEAVTHTQRAITLGYTDTSNPIFGRLGIDPEPSSGAVGDSLRDVIKAFTS
ncbi:MAG TPA: hypothetical protein VF600_11135 [Abditibacteriaceae bacterium]|jgi:tetratricopeptide (TPR) repeat protein